MQCESITLYLYFSVVCAFKVFQFLSCICMYLSIKIGNVASTLFIDKRSLHTCAIYLTFMFLTNSSIKSGLINYINKIELQNIQCLFLNGLITLLTVIKNSSNTLLMI